MKNSLYAFGLVLVGASSTSVLAQPPGHPPEHQASLCAPSSGDWFKNAYNYTHASPQAAGKRPVVYVTVSMTSLAPAEALAGKTPDRTTVWYSKGELAVNSFPVSPYYMEGTLPLWSNSGPPNAPFGNNNQTLKVVLQDNGDTTFQYQISGRNRLGKGPQVIKFPAALGSSSDTTLVWSTKANFFGNKRIVVTFTKGEATVKAPPVGARYRVTPSFIVTNSDDGAGDNSVELKGHITFRHLLNDKKQQNIPDFSPSGTVKAGPLGLGTVLGAPFEIDVYDEKSLSHTKYLDIYGHIEDHDKWSHNDPLWDKPSTGTQFARIKIPDIIAKGGTVTIKGDGDSESGDLQLTITKVSDLY